MEGGGKIATKLELEMTLCELLIAGSPSRNDGAAHNESVMIVPACHRHHPDITTYY